MARDILDLGADVYDDTQEAKKHRISPKKRNYIIGLSITGVLLAGAITFTVIASNLWLQDVTNLTNIQFYFTPPSEGDEEEPTLTLYKLDPNTVYPETFRIPEKVQGYKVTAIAPDAFNGHYEIKKLIFTQYVDTVGDRAFYGCAGLEEIVWNKALVNIGTNAFGDTKFYTNLVNDPKGFLALPSGLLLYVGVDYFDNNTALVSDSITEEEKTVIKSKYSIEDDDFYRFSDLNVSSFVAGLFKGNDKITYIDFPEFLSEIGGNTFYGCTKLKGINFTHSEVTRLDTGAFENCTSLKDISFSDKLAFLGDEVFANTAVTSLPELHNLKSIGSGIFKGCKSLTKVYYPAGTYVSSVPEAMFENCTSLKEIYWGDENNDAMEYIDKIGYSAFKNTAFEEFTVPHNVSIIYDNTFSGCKNLKTLYLYGNPLDEVDPSSIVLDEDGNVSYDVSDITGEYEINMNDTITIKLDDREEMLIAPNSDGEYHIEIENPSPDILMDKVTFTLTEDDYIQLNESDEITIYDDTRIFSLYLGFDYVELSNAANYSINSEGEYVLGYIAGVRDIRSKAFLNCANFDTIKLYDDDGNYTGENGKFTFPKSIIYLNKDSFNGSENSTFEGTSAKSIYFDSNVKGIGVYSFSNMTELESVSFAEDSTLKSVGGGAFQGDVKLKAISLPNTVTTLGSSAFEGCESLETIDIDHTSIATIRDETFKDCISLKHIDLPETVDSIRANAFRNNTKLDHVVIPHGLTQINANAFNKCRELGVEDKLPIYFEKTTKEFNEANIDANFLDETAYYSLLLKEGDVKVPGQSYWNGDKENIQEILPEQVTFEGELVKTSYKDGDDFDPEGLTFIADYLDETIANVTLDGNKDIEWDILVAGQTEAHGQYRVGNLILDVTVTGITVSE